MQLAAGLDAALAVTPPHIDLDAEFSVQLNGVKVDVKPADLKAALTQGAGQGAMEQRIRQDTGMDDTPHLEVYGNNAIGPIDQSLQDAAARSLQGQGPSSPLPPVGEPLVYEDPVVPVWPPTSTPGASA